MNRWRYVWPALLWAGAICVFSTELFGASETSRFLLPLLRWLLPHAPMERLIELHHLIRKCAHVFEYFVLALLVMRAIRGARAGWDLRWAVGALAICVAWACLDEFHQVFVPGRTASPWDALLDSSAALAALAIFGAIARWTSSPGTAEPAKTELAGPA
jgi:VanZ family protein